MSTRPDSRTPPAQTWTSRGYEHGPDRLRTGALSPVLLARGLASQRHAARHGVPGIEFARYGRRTGLRLLARGRRQGLRLLLVPVSSVRYFEFDFVRSCLPVAPGRCLDVSSPQLFSLFAAERTSARVMAWNPDPADIGATAAIASALSVDRLETAVAGVDRLAEDPGGYDCIWSISVIEHIAGDYDDSDAIRWMYDALAPGGRLMLTVPVAREYGHEFHDRDYSGTQPRDEDQGYFFSRHYDRDAVWERLLAPIGREPSRVAWYGETTPGLWRNYQDRWAREGVPATVDDPRLLANGFRSYSSWEQMPGVGVCGLLIDKK